MALFELRTRRVPDHLPIAHSFVIAIPLVVAVSLAALHYGRPTIPLFTVGSLSHLPGDYYTVAYTGNGQALHDRYWPPVHVKPIDYGADFTHVAVFDGTSTALTTTTLHPLAYASPTLARLHRRVRR